MVKANHVLSNSAQVFNDLLGLNVPVGPFYTKTCLA